MKFSTIITVLAVALCAAGCKYNKAGKGGNGTDVDGANANGNGIDISNMSTSGRLGDLGENKFEDMYARCTDVNFAPVYFGFDSSVVPPGELGKVDAVARHLVDKPERVVVVEGNCDERGSNEYNMSLGQNRAQIVLNYLMQSGIDASRIQARSYGEENPAADGHDEASWARNRRDDFAIFDTSVRK